MCVLCVCGGEAWGVREEVCVRENSNRERKDELCVRVRPRVCVWYNLS